MSNPSQRKKLPANPSLEHLQKQAKRRVKATPGLELAAAQHQLAQEYGCKNWAELVREIEAATQRQALLERFVDAQRLARERKPEEALSALLWCLDQSMKAPPGTTGVQPAFVVSALAHLSTSYPPALQAVRKRSDQIRLISRDYAPDLPPETEPRAKIAYGRYWQANLMAVRGEKPEEALSELLWCFDEGMKDSAMRGMRRNFLLGAISRLGKTHPPALVALQERRGKIRINWQNDAEEWRDFASINLALKEESATLAFYDELRRTGASLPDPRWIFDALVEAKRYADAVAAKPVEVHLRTFNDYLERTARNPYTSHAIHVIYLAKLSAKQTEALAGAGDLANARVVIAKMIEFDGSEETLNLLRAHAVRACHPELVPAN